MTATRPRLDSGLETVLYSTDYEKTEHFYSEILGMRLISKDSGKHIFYRAGSSDFLLFKPEKSLKRQNLPPHGAKGSIHGCFLAPKEDYEAWKTHLKSQGIRFLQEASWSEAYSFYFHDPDRNLLEYSNAEIWPQ